MENMLVKLFLIWPYGSVLFKDFLRQIYFSYGGHLVRFSGTFLCKFGKGHYGKNSCYIILNLDLMSFIDFFLKLSIFSFDGFCLWRSITFCKILVKASMRCMCVN